MQTKIKRGRAAVFINSLINSPLGGSLAVIAVLSAICVVVYLWWCLNFMLIKNDWLPLLDRPPIGTSATLWCGLQFLIVFFGLACTVCVTIVIKETFVKVRNDLHEYDIESAQLGEKQNQ